LSHIRNFGMLRFRLTTGQHVTPIQNLTSGRHCAMHLPPRAFC
jgi:hypothetical protein